MIPNKFHFIFGLKEDFGGKPFKLCHYLSIKSALDLNKPEEAYLYYKFMPTGEWFDKIKDRLTLVEIEPPTEIFGKPLMHYAHQADVIRLRMLYEYGGVYMDVDTISVKPLTDLLDNKCVLGIEKNQGLCNGVVLAEKNSLFIKHWLDSYRTFRSRGRDKHWGEHSVRIPNRLSKQYPDLITAEPFFSFHYPTWRQEDLKLMFEENKTFENAYCHHVWETRSWEPYLKDLSEEHIKNVDTTYNNIARNFL